MHWREVTDTPRRVKLKLGTHIHPPLTPAPPFSPWLSHLLIPLSSQLFNITWQLGWVKANTCFFWDAWGQLLHLFNLQLMHHSNTVRAKKAWSTLFYIHELTVSHNWSDWSVAVIDRRDRVCPSHPENMASFCSLRLPDSGGVGSSGFQCFLLSSNNRKTNSANLIPARINWHMQ